jgi:hypothetical protein
MSTVKCLATLHRFSTLSTRTAILFLAAPRPPRPRAGHGDFLQAGLGGGQQ